MTEAQQTRYEQIKKHGFLIDTRGPKPTLINGMITSKFNTFDECLAAAEAAIEQKR